MNAILWFILLNEENKNLQVQQALFYYFIRLTEKLYHAFSLCLYMVAVYIGICYFVLYICGVEAPCSKQRSVTSTSPHNGGRIWTPILVRATLVHGQL